MSSGFALKTTTVELMVLIADYQTSTDRDSPAALPHDVEELAADHLAVGIDPRPATIFAHSQVPELNQLLLPFLSRVTLPELLRNPTVKDEAAAAGMTALSGRMLAYPVHQAADILFGRATLVPVGADQLPHVEQTCPAVQSPLRAGPACLSRARGAAQRCPGPAGPRRAQDEQEPQQRDRARCLSRADRAIAPGHQHGL